MRLRHLIWVALVSLIALPCRAQAVYTASIVPATGAYNWGSFDNRGFDSINLGNLNVHFAIPIVQKQGRGTPFNYSLTYDGLIWSILATSPLTLVNDPGWGFHGQDGKGIGGYLSYSSAYVSGTCNPSSNYGSSSGDVLTGFIYHDTLGIGHSLNFTQTICGVTATYSGTGNASDGSGFTIAAAPPATYPSTFLQVKNRYGAVVYMASSGTPSDGSTTDANGNSITNNGNGVFTDTLGVNALTISGEASPTSPTTLTYPAVKQQSGATSATDTIYYKTYTVQTNFQCSGLTDYGANSIDLIDHITLADGSSTYTFTYETTPGLSNGATTGRIASVTLPTGGTISYQYSGGCNNSGFNPDGSTATLTRITSDGTRTYTRSAFPAPAYGLIYTYSGTTTLQDEKGNQSVYSMVSTGDGDGLAYYYETDRKMYQGAAGGTLLMEQATCYNGQTGADCASVSLPITEINSITSLNGIASYQTDTTYNSAGQATSIAQKDPANGNALLATITNAYNDIGKLTSTSTSDGGGNTYQSSIFNYDEGSVTATSGLPQHGSPAVTERGNLTSTHVWTGGSNYLVSTTSFYDTGQPVSTTDPYGATTGYTYDATQGFVTNTTMQTALPSGATLSTSATYDLASGWLTGSTGMNSDQTTIDIYDGLGRPRQITPPSSSGVVIGAYTPTSTDVAQFMDSPASGRQTEAYTQLDGYGRTNRTAVKNDTGWYLTDYCYDGVGLLQKQTMPYSNANYTDPVNCSQSAVLRQYDALGRMLSITKADGSSTALSYLNRSVLTTTLDASANVLTRRVVAKDALGRISSVCEVTSTTLTNSGAPGSCGGDYPGLTGYLTTYAYDDFNHKTWIYQGVQTRVFQTDAAGRPIYSLEPESGETDYSYSSNATGRVVTRKKPKANQTASTTQTTTTTQYDALGRVVSISYDDGTPTKNYGYDQTYAGSGFPFANGLGRMTTAAGPDITEFQYDNSGRMTTTLQCFPGKCGAPAYDTWRYYSYDFAGDRKSDSMYFYGGNTDTVGRTYTTAGEVATVTASGNDFIGAANNGGSLVSAVTQGPLGPTLELLGNGIKQIYDYSGNGQLSTAISCVGGTGPGGCASQFLYANVEQIVGPRVTTVADLAIGQDHIINNMGYDDLNRLSSVSYPDIGKAFNMQFDRYGNKWLQTVTAGSGSSLSYSFDQTSNRLTTAGFSYDAAGNLSTDGLHTYIYDAEGKLTAIDPYSGHEIDYVYDALNRRVQVATSTSNTFYGFDIDGNRATTWDGSGTGITLLSANAYFNGQLLATFKIGTGVYYAHADVQGTVRVTTDYTGATASSYSSMPFGDSSSTTGTNPDPQQYALLDRDTFTDTHHAQFREYHPTSGRWMSPDPYSGSYRLWNPQSLNRYAYVLNNPLYATDAAGLEEYPCAEEGDDDITCPDYENVEGNGPGGAFYAPGDIIGYIGGVPIIEGGSGSYCLSCSMPGMNDYLYWLYMNSGSVSVIPTGSGGGGSAPNNGQQNKPTIQSRMQKAAHAMCGTSPAGRVAKSVMSGFAIGFGVGAFKGFVGGELFGGEVTLGATGLVGAVAGGFIQGAVGAMNGLGTGTALAAECQAGFMYDPN